MRQVVEAFAHALGWCFRPRVIALSVLPLLLMVALFAVLHIFFMDAAVAQVQRLLQWPALLQALWNWLEQAGAPWVLHFLAVVLVVVMALPLLLLVAVIVVSPVVTPVVAGWIAQRRFPALERRRGASWVGSAMWSLRTAAQALLMLVASLPLCLLLPLWMVIPPLIWGWLTYRVMAFDALAEFASADERQEIFRRKGLFLLLIGVFSVGMGALPGLIWAFSTFFVVALFVFLVPVAVWLYTLVLVFSSLWFAHYCLAALEDLRAQNAAATPQPPQEGVVDVQAVEVPGAAGAARPQDG